MTVDPHASRNTAAPNTGATTLSRAPWWTWVLGGAIAAIPIYTTYRMVEVNGQLAAIERERVQLINDKQRVDAALEAGRKQIDELKSKQGAAADEIKKSRDDARDASRQMKEAQERTKVVEAELAKLKEQMGQSQGDADRLRQETEAAKKGRTDAETRANTLGNEITALKTQLDEFREAAR